MDLTWMACTVSGLGSYVDFVRYRVWLAKVLRNSPFPIHTAVRLFQGHFTLRQLHPVAFLREANETPQTTHRLPMIKLSNHPVSCFLLWVMVKTCLWRYLFQVLGDNPFPRHPSGTHYQFTALRWTPSCRGARDSTCHSNFTNDGSFAATLCHQKYQK